MRQVYNPARKQPGSIKRVSRGSYDEAVKHFSAPESPWGYKSCQGIAGSSYSCKDFRARFHWSLQGDLSFKKKDLPLSRGSVSMGIRSHGAEIDLQRPCEYSDQSNTADACDPKCRTHSLDHMYQIVDPIDHNQEIDESNWVMIKSYNV